MNDDLFMFLNVLFEAPVDGGGAAAPAVPAAGSQNAEVSRQNGGQAAPGGKDTTGVPGTSETLAPVATKGRAQKSVPKFGSMDDLVAATNSKFGKGKEEAAPGMEDGKEHKRTLAPDVEDGKATSGTLAPEDYAEGFEPDPVDVDGEKYFYHPSVHGKDTGQGTTYKNRDAAEYGLSAKVERIRELTSLLNKDGHGVGAVNLPEWFEDPNNPDAILELGSPEVAIGLPNADLRKRIEESDSLITHLTNRKEKVLGGAPDAEVSAALNQEREALVSSLDNLLDELGVEGDIDIDMKAENPTQELLTQLKSARDAKVAAALKPELDALTALKNDSDARYEDDYADKLLEAHNAVEAKRVELTSSFNEKFGVLDEITEFAKKAANPSAAKPKETEAAKVSRITDVLKALGTEKSDHIIFKSTDARGLQQFFNFVVQNADEYNGIKTTYDANRALQAYEAKLEALRAAQRKAKVDASSAQAKAQNPMPEYGKLPKSALPAGHNKHEVMNRNLDELANATDARLKR